MDDLVKIPGFNRYLISNHGHVYTIKKNGLRLMRPHLDKRGYWRLSLTKDKIEKNYFVHRLVLSAFERPPRDLEQCNHKDGIKTNNHISNLEWVSGEENIRHSFAMGLRATGANRTQAKLSHEDVIDILNDKDLQSVIAKKYQVSTSTINYIKIGRTYKESHARWVNMGESQSG